MSLARWSPFDEFIGFDAPINRLFRQATPRTEDVVQERGWMPAVDVYETEDHAMVVSAELPGLDNKDVTVTFDSGVLTIAGERKRDTEIDRDRLYRSERAFGTFRRSFTVPRTVDAAAVTAEHKDGMLRVRLPLKEEAKSRRITVDAA